MPSRNVYKTLVKDGYYHVYNRGVEKRQIFLNQEDYVVFLNNLKYYLSKPDNAFLKCTTPQKLNNYYLRVNLLAYCLMPNHFHLLIKQKDTNSLKDFMKSLTVKYSMYFNKKYERVGQLFQGRYKAVLITDENYLLHLSRYIHLNPIEYAKNLVYAFSSYAEYLNIRNTTWVKPDFILNFFNKKVFPEFKKAISYKYFVENSKKDSTKILSRLTLED